MEQGTSPHALHVFVCEQTRGDGHPSCGERWDAKEAVRQLKEATREAGVAVRISRAGCLGPCGQGPNVVLYPEGIWFRGCRLEDLPEIARAAIAAARGPAPRPT